MIGRFSFGKEIFFGEVEGGIVRRKNKGKIKEYSLAELKILTPTLPSKIVCVGLNYRDHARELGMSVPDCPIIFLKPPSAVIAHLEEIVYPSGVKELDYEAELAVVIGKRCKNVPADNAEEVILGYTCFNDVTARDLQRADGQWTRAKSFDTFAPLGPFIVNGSLAVNNLYIWTRINGVLRQHSNTENLIFDIPHLIEFISHIMTLEAGDVIATGTPPGVGRVEVGDVVEIEIEKVGTLINKVVKQVEGVIR